MSNPDYIVEIQALTEETASDSAAALTGRPWVGIRFDCCGVYTRVYRNAEGTAYQGFCPRCLKKVRLAVGSEGVDSRFFRAQ